MKTLLGIILILQNLFHEIASQCQCSGASAAPQIPIPSNFQMTEEIVDGKNFGVPVVINKKVFLKPDITAIRGIASLQNVCPFGWRLPTAEEFEDVLTNPVSTLISQLNMTDGVNYLTSTKTFPNVTSGSDTKAWEFRGFKFNAKNTTVSLSSVNTFFSSPLAIKCVQDTAIPMEITNIFRDWVVNKQYTVSVKRSNLAGYAWKLNGNTKNTQEASLSSNRLGCNAVDLWAVNAAGQILYNCREVWVSLPFGSDGATSSVNISEINTNLTAQRTTNLHFDKGSVPVAPKPAGGFLVLYTETTTNDIYVLEYNNKFEQVNKKSLGFKAWPTDIIAADNGFFVYLRDYTDNNKGFVVAYDYSFNQQWTKNVMNNGDNPTAAKDQIGFYNRDGKVNFGNEAMYKSMGAKLAYGRGRYGVIFSHYNAFGLTGPRNDHQGDSFYDFEAKTGKDVYYAWSWAVSHSVTQNHIYDGRWFVTAALGDIYPENIKVCLIDMIGNSSDYDSVNKGYFKRNSICRDIVKGKIVGDGAGRTCGRLGGLVQLGDIIGLVYARKACSITNLSGLSTSTDSEIGLITFNTTTFNLTDIKYYTFGSAENVVGIRAGKYGKNIFITYTTVDTSVGNNPQVASISGDPAKEKQYSLLVSFNGDVVTPATLNTGTPSVSAVDQMRYLNDGTPVWANVDKNNKLYIFSLPTPPQTWTNSGPVDSGSNSNYLSGAAILLLMVLLF